MRKCVLFILIMVAVTGIFLTVMAQDDKGKFDREVFMAKRNAYITASAGLTADEAAAFIPIENEMQRKKFEIGRDCRKLARRSRSKEGLTEEEQQKLVDCTTETRLKEAKLEKEYHEKFKRILSVEKLYKYQEAEARFMREFMQKRGRGGHGGGSHQGKP